MFVDILTFGVMLSGLDLLGGGNAFLPISTTVELLTISMGIILIIN